MKVEVEMSSETHLGLVDGGTTTETSEVLELQVLTTSVAGISTSLGDGT